jgi:hypothetical protein
MSKIKVANQDFKDYWRDSVVVVKKGQTYSNDSELVKLHDDKFDDVRVEDVLVKEPIKSELTKEEKEKGFELLIEEPVSELEVTIEDDVKEEVVETSEKPKTKRGRKAKSTK